MANPYYSNADPGKRFQPGTTVKGGDVDGKFDETQAGFDGAYADTQRAIKLLSEEGVSQELSETALQRRGRVLGFDADGKLSLRTPGNWRGDWATATVYYVNDVFRDPATGDVYWVEIQHTSDTVANDLSAGNIAKIVDVAQIKGYRDDAQTAASTATTKADEAASSASSALSSASTATTKAGEASSSASAAANAASAAAASYDSFDDRYLGAKSSDPATDNDGDPLLVGALYFNSTAGKMRQWDGAAWRDSYATVDFGDAALSDLQPAQWQTISADTTLAANGWYAVDFTAGPLTLTLPATPANNDMIRLYKSAGNAIDSIIARNGQTIMGLAEDMTIDSEITSLDIVFNGADWRIV